MVPLRAPAMLWTVATVVGVAASSCGGSEPAQPVLGPPPPAAPGATGQRSSPQTTAPPADPVGPASPASATSGQPPASTDVEKDRDQRLKAVQPGWTQAQVTAHVGPADSVQSGVWWYQWMEPNGGRYSRWRLEFDAAGRVTHIRQFVGEIVPF